MIWFTNQQFRDSHEKRLFSRLHLLYSLVEAAIVSSGCHERAAINQIEVQQWNGAFFARENLTQLVADVASVPGAFAGPQSGVPTVPGVPVGAHTGVSSVPSTPAWPQSGAPTMPGAPAGPQSGLTGVPHAPAWPLSGAPGVPHAPAGAQGGALSGHGTTALRVAGKGAAHGLRHKLLGTTAGKIISGAVATAVVATTVVVVIIARHPSPQPAPAAPSVPIGTVTEFALPAGSAPNGLTTGPDGNVWFTDQLSEQVGRITPTGTITEFSPPPMVGMIGFITTGSDGNLWFAKDAQIGRVTPQGQITEFPLATKSTDIIIAGPGGYVWFTEANAIGRIKVKA